MPIPCLWLEPLYIPGMFPTDLLQPVSRRFHLRKSTAAEHKLLYAMVGTFSDRAAYRAYVRSIYAFRMPLERAIASTGLLSGFLPWSPLMIGDALEDDVDVLEIDRPEDLQEPPAIDTPEALYGLLYTLEGSSLGAQLLVKRAAELGFGAESGAAHLVRQAGAIESWKGFCNQLEVVRTLDMAGVSDAACGTFERARQSFSRFGATGSAAA